MKIKAYAMLLVAIELIVIAFMVLRIFSIKDKVSVSAIKKGNLNVKGVSALKYFYDLKPDYTETVSFPWLQGKIINETNHDGLNDIEDYSETKPTDVFRIMALGDSFTYGVYVNTADNWPEKLEKKLNTDLKCKNYRKIEVINLGVPGYDVEYEVERYRLRGQKYNPDLIIWMLVDDKRILEKSNQYLETCKNKRGKISLDQPPDYECSIEAENHVISEYGKQYVNKYISNKIEALLGSYGKTVVAVDINGLHKDILNLVKNGDNLKILRTDYFGKTDLELPDGHPNTKGHEFFMNGIYDYIVSNHLIPCEKYP